MSETPPAKRIKLENGKGHNDIMLAWFRSSNELGINYKIATIQIKILEFVRSKLPDSLKREFTNDCTLYNKLMLYGLQILPSECERVIEQKHANHIRIRLRIHEHEEQDEHCKHCHLQVNMIIQRWVHDVVKDLQISSISSNIQVPPASQLIAQSTNLSSSVDKQTESSIRKGKGKANEDSGQATLSCEASSNALKEGASNSQTERSEGDSAVTATSSAFEAENDGRISDLARHIEVLGKAYLAAVNALTVQAIQRVEKASQIGISTVSRFPVKDALPTTNNAQHQQVGPVTHNVQHQQNQQVGPSNNPPELHAELIDLSSTTDSKDATQFWSAGLIDLSSP